MLGSTPITAVLGAAPAATADTATLKSFAKAATAAGLALLLIAPGSKEPVDMRSPKHRRDDDEAAQAAARERGRADWMKARSLAGAHLATTNATHIGRYIDKYRKTYGDDVGVNFAIEVGRSNLIVVDTDTTEQTTAFLTRAGAPAELPPTVKSPGSRDHATGEWAHYGGGHFYFTVPTGVELPTGSGSLTVADGEYAILWRDRYLLIPPSTRPEGTYTVVGREYEAPAWIVEMITERAQRRVRAATAADGLGLDGVEMSEKIDTWSETVSWADLLAPLGWAETARPDGRCGCPVWTAPGSHHSPKSATTHDTGCELDRYTAVNAPMHVWTDNPGEPFESWIAERGTKTLTKLQVLAIGEYDGDVGAASAAVGVITGGGIALEMGVDAGSMNTDAAPEIDTTSLDQPIEIAESPAIGGEPAVPTGDKTMTLHRPIYETPEGSRDHTCELCGVADFADRFDFVEGKLVHDPTVCAANGAAEVTEAESLPYEVPLSPSAEQAAAEPDPPADGNPLGFGPIADETPEPEPGATEQSTEFPADDTPPVDPIDDMMLVSESNGVPKIAPFGYWREFPAPEYAIDGLIEQNALSCVIGPPGVGKSTFIIDIACSLVTGIRWHGRKVRRQRVLYLPGEGLAGAAERIRAWELAHDLDVHPDLLMGNAIIQLAAAREDWATVLQYVMKHRVGMIVFDTFARMSLGIEENSATDVGKAIARFDQIRKITGAGVMVIHHTGKTSESGRGSSALNGALDSELLIRPAKWDTSDVAEGEPIEMVTTKQKNAARLRDPLPLVLTPMHGSVVVTGPTGVVGDPIDAMAVPPLHTPEPVIELAVRLRNYLDRFTEAGLTRGDMVTGIEIDPYTAGLRDPRTAWKHRVYEAVDLGLRLALIETTTGKPSGARFIPGPIGREAARRAVADEAMNVTGD